MLTGTELDAAVAAHEDKETVTFIILGAREDDPHPYSPSTKWAHGGPIIEREGIALRCVGAYWFAMHKDDCGNCTGMRWSEYTVRGGQRYGKASYQVRKRKQRFTGETALIAAMRCYMGHKVPEYENGYQM